MVTNREGIQTKENPSHIVYVSGWSPNIKYYDGIATLISTTIIEARSEIKFKHPFKDNNDNGIGCNKQSDILHCKDKRKSCCFL